MVPVILLKEACGRWFGGDQLGDEALGLIPSTAYTKCGGVTCNSSFGEVESGESEIQDSPQLHSEFKAKDKGIGFEFVTSTGPDRPNQES